MTDIWNTVVMLVLLTSYVIPSPVPTTEQTGKKKTSYFYGVEFLGFIILFYNFFLPFLFRLNS